MILVISVDEIVLVFVSILSSLLVALIAVMFDRWLGNKKELNSIFSGLLFEIVENISIAETIVKKAEKDLRALQVAQHAFAPFPTFSDVAYLRAKNSEAFLNFVGRERSGRAQELFRDLHTDLHECYSSIRLVNYLIESIQELKIEIMTNRCPKEYGELLVEETRRGIVGVIEPKLREVLLLIRQVEPRLHQNLSVLRETFTSKGENMT